jgi:predicted transcriptional regulator
VVLLLAAALVLAGGAAESKDSAGKRSTGAVALVKDWGPTILPAVAFAVGLHVGVNLFLYSRVPRDRALEHPVRRAIYDEAQSNPGRNLREFVDLTGRPYGVVRHHVHLMQRLELLRTVRHGTALHVFPIEYTTPRAKADLLARTDPAMLELVRHTRTQPAPMSQLLATIQESFGLSRMGSWKVLRRAELAGLVERGRTDDGMLVRARA